MFLIAFKTVTIQFNRVTFFIPQNNVEAMSLKRISYYFLAKIKKISLDGIRLRKKLFSGAFE